MSFSYPVFDLHADTYYKRLLLHQFPQVRKAQFPDPNQPDQWKNAPDMFNVTPENLAAGNVKVQVQSLYLSRSALLGALHHALTMIHMMKTDIRKHDHFFQVYESQDIEAHRQDDMTGILISIEGLEVIEGDLDMLDIFHELGVRMVAPTWNRVLPYAPSFFEDYGLFRQGKDLARKMNELGLIMDISHMAPKASLEFADLLDVPIIATHSNLRSLNPFPRNLTDAQMDMLKERQGVFGLTFCPDFMSMPEPVLQDGYPRGFHLLYRFIAEAIDRWGIDTIAIGSDFDGLVDEEPGLNDPTCYPGFAAFLAYKGLTDTEIRAILMENALRVLRYNSRV